MDWTRAEKISLASLVIALASVGFTASQCSLAYRQDARAVALKKPALDVIPQAKDGRHWTLTVTITNRSDERILPVGFEIPSPDGGYIKMRQIGPAGSAVENPEMNSQVKWTIPGRAIPSGETGIWSAEYEIADAFPARPDVALTLRAKIKYLGPEERREELTVVRQLN